LFRSLQSQASARRKNNRDALLLPTQINAVRAPASVMCFQPDIFLF
jgi:hypothetical protein